MPPSPGVVLGPELGTSSKGSGWHGYLRILSQYFLSEGKGRGNMCPFFFFEGDPSLSPLSSGP